MPFASTPRSVVSGLMMGAIGSFLIVMPTAPQGNRSNSPLECESGILDPGENGMDVLVYESCLGRLAVGFQGSEVIEELSCMPSGAIQLWLLADHARCKGQPTSSHDQVYELWEPLKGIGRATAAPVRQLLTCRIGTMNRATIVVPDARAAILETRTGDTKYGKLTRQFISRCVRPDA